MPATNPPLKDNAILPLRFLRLSAESHWACGCQSLLLRLALPLPLDLLPYSSVDSQLEDFIDALGLFTTAFDVHSTHSFCDGLTLFWCDGCQALSFEELYASALGTKVRFETDEDQRGGWTEV